jgi:oxygen-independent coproporphyrinogen-3 oxidase
MKAGLYIHIPFCISKCAYCDFYSLVTERSIIDQFLDALESEIDLYASHQVIADLEFETLYLGGGTPSLLSIGQIDKLVNQAQSLFRFSEYFEFTIEANPETISLNKLKEYIAIGVNRLSLGIQSFRDSELQTLGRIHHADQAKNCIEWAVQAGFDNINLDLVFAVPGQTLNKWQQNLQQAIQYKPKHLSIYCLTIEPGTPLQQKILSGEIEKLNDETEREMYLWTIAALSQAGYQQYEISNFSLQGFECRHNLSYWNGTPYLGLGPSAHSFWDSHRQWNVASVEKYVDLLTIGTLPTAGQEALTWEQKILEFLYLNLRTNQGIDIFEFESQFRVSFTEKFQRVLKRLNKHADGDLFQFQKDKFKLRPNGFVLFDEICQYFADEI